MEREPSPAPSNEKLIDVVAREYPSAEILVSFPENWEVVHTFQQGDRSLYVAGFPLSQERARGDHFYGLSPEINRSLTQYRLYKLFEPWPQPVWPVAWDTLNGQGVVLPGGYLTVRLRPLGQAQIWRGEQHGVLWECFGHSMRKWPEHEMESLVQFWQAVEQDIGVQTNFTQPHEPAFEGDYLAFLSSLGYVPHPDLERWWSKTR